MTQELVTVCMSDIGRLLGTLGLLSLGITLTLWGLKRRRSGAVVIALFLCLAALVPTVLAIEHPPPGSLAQIQTSGPNGALENGDWYTSRNPDAGGPGYHSFVIYVPCTVPPAQTITVELYDPESNYTTIDGAPYPDLDEIRPDPGVPVPDNTTFTLLAPDAVTIVATNTYTPDGGTSQTWVPFTTFTRGDNGCRTVMTYTLRVTTSDDDDNAWKLRITPDDPDGTPGTGDEISVGNLKTSYQNESFGCQTFHFFVEDVISITLSNFDWDVPYLCPVVSCTLDYITPSGAVIPGTVSGSTVWNNGGPDYPPPGGNVILNPESGWWQAAFCMTADNQWIFDPSVVYFYIPPPPPKMSVSKDDGTETFVPGGVLTYTITYTSGGEGAALEAVLTDTLPLSATFVSCSGGLSCGEIPPPGSGIVTFSLGTIISRTSGSVLVSVRVDGDVPPGCITNTVELRYKDTRGYQYPPERDTDVDCYQANAAIEIAKTVYLGHDSGAGCPGGESVTGANGAAVTYCFVVNNTGDTYLDDITIDDADLGIDETQMTLLSGSTPLAPGASLVYYYESTITGDLVNTAEVDGNPTDAGGNDLPGVDNPTADDTAEVDQTGPGIEIAKTVYLGHDSGAGCPGSEIVTGANGADVTYCFEVTNTGSTYLDDIAIRDADLGIDQSAMTLLSGSTPLASGDSLIYYYEGTINGYLVNTAETEGNPTDAGGNDLPGLDNPTAAADATVDILLVDPAITKSGDPTVAWPGEIVTFILRVTNGGTADAHDVLVTDVVPEYLSIRSAVSTKGTPIITGQTVVVDIGTIAGSNSEEVVITIVTEVRAGTPPGTVIENQASLVFREGDRQSNIVYVEVRGPPYPTPTPVGRLVSPPLIPPPLVTLTPTVEVLTVAVLPETGGFPSGFTLVLGVPIIIGAAGLLNLALLEVRGRRGDGKGD